MSYFLKIWDTALDMLQEKKRIYEFSYYMIVLKPVWPTITRLYPNFTKN